MYQVEPIIAVVHTFFFRKTINLNLLNFTVYLFIRFCTLCRKNLLDM